MWNIIKSSRHIINNILKIEWFLRKKIKWKNIGIRKREIRVERGVLEWEKNSRIKDGRNRKREELIIKKREVDIRES